MRQLKFKYMYIVSNDFLSFITANGDVVQNINFPFLLPCRTKEFNIVVSSLNRWAKPTVFGAYAGNEV